MLKEFVEKIQDITFERIEFDGRYLSTKPLHPILDPLPSPLALHTLQGIADVGESLVEQKCMVHVKSWDRAELVGPIEGREKQRSCYAVATSYEHHHKFDQSVPLDTFLVYIQSSFVQDETTAAILRVLGNVVQGSEAEYADDGITQRVTARAGVTRREFVDLPNPVTLRPYRTFPDIEQPASKFVLRIKAGRDGEQPACMLVEADGGAWKNQAITSIKEFFAGKGVTVVG